MGQTSKFLPFVVASVLSLALLPLVVDDAFAGGPFLPNPIPLPILGDFKCYDTFIQPLGIPAFTIIIGPPFPFGPPFPNLNTAVGPDLHYKCYEISPLTLFPFGLQNMLINI